MISNEMAFARTGLGSGGREPRTLFVYGTLMSTARCPMGRAQRRTLRWHARLAGRATVQGLLHQMEGYPGIAWSKRGRDVVHGEAWRIVRPRPLWRLLDSYEGLDRSPPDYAREPAMIRLVSGLEVPAWVYRPLCAITTLPPVPNGRWRSRVETLVREPEGRRPSDAPEG